MARRQRVFTSGLVLGGAAMFVAVAVSAASSQGPAPSPAPTPAAWLNPTLSVLSRPAGPAHTLSDGVLALPVGDVLARPIRARRTAPSGRLGQSLYVAQGLDDRVCLMSVADVVSGTPNVAGTCAARTQLATSGLYLLLGDSDGERSLQMVVPDGVTKVTSGAVSVPVTSNTAVLTGAALGKSVTFSDAAGHSSYLDLGPIGPAPVVGASAPAGP